MKVILIAALIVFGVAASWYSFNQDSTQEANTSQLSVANLDFTQIDYQTGVKVLAMYLPEESSSDLATIRLEITSSGTDLLNYNYGEKIILADNEIEDLPTVKAEALTKEKDKLEVKMYFSRSSGSHHHLLVKDLAGIRDRVLHFYLNQ